jgi:signal transduction histidine kinase
MRAAPARGGCDEGHGVGTVHLVKQWFLGDVRWLREHHLAADGLLAALLLVLALIGAVAPAEGSVIREADAFAFVLLVGQTVPIVWRRRHPIPVLAATLAFLVPYLVLEYPSTAGSITSLIAIYTVAAHCDRRRALTAGVAAAVVMVAVLVAGILWAEEDITFDVFVGNFVIFGTAWILGDNLRNRRAYLGELEERAARLERDREGEARRAVAQERTRIARELHDVVAHNMSVMVVQAGAARRVMQTRPEDAAAALASIEAAGREGLTEMRRLLGVLRRDDERSLALAPQPSMEHVEELVARSVEAGIEVDLEVEGQPRPLPAGVDLSAYRIVQEALTNVLKHAGPAKASVRVRYRPDALEVEVVDDGRGLAAAAAAGDGSGSVNGSGHGLVGMRERVALFGGELRVGPRRGGGFAVHARLPA